jgi:hypothetical protein
VRTFLIQYDAILLVKMEVEERHGY